MTNGHFPVPQESVEAGLLAAINQDVGKWLSLDGITSDDFVAHREIFLFMEQYLQQYGNLPSSSLISSRFEWHPPVGDFAYWLVEMRRYVMAGHVLSVVQEGYNRISDPNLSLDYMLDKLSLLRSGQTNHIQATDASANERFEKYLNRQEYLFNGNRLLGLPTGMKIIDNTKIGWTPGSLVGVYSRPSVGKTWWLMWQGIMSWAGGYTVLAVTPEMPANWLDLRVDVLAGNVLGLPIEYNALLRGDPSIQPNYELVTKRLAESQRWWTYDSLNDRPVGLGDLAGLIRQHKPDVILIDGVSLLRSDSRGQTWEQMKEICYGLKNLATIYELPILVTHQAVNSARGRRTEITAMGRGDDFLMPSLNDVAFGDAFVQACSDVITMVGDVNLSNIRWYSIRKHRERGWDQELPAKMALAVDYARGKIIDMSERGYSPETIGHEADRVLQRTGAFG